MKASNANKAVSVLLSVAMCPMMVPTAAFANEEGAQPGAPATAEQQVETQAEEAAEANAETATDSVERAEVAKSVARAGEDEAVVAESNEAEASVQEADETPAVSEAVATIGDQSFASLKEAIASVTDGTETVITLHQDVTAGDGIEIPSGRNITIDLGGHTYAVTQNYVGSGNNKNAFWFLKDSYIVVKNGVLKGQHAPIVVQNYSNLTLDGVNVVGGKFSTYTKYLLSINNGHVVLKNGTALQTVQSSQFAVNVCYGMSGYPNGSSLEVGDSSVNLSGKFELQAYGEATADQFAEKVSIIAPKDWSYKNRGTIAVTGNMGDKASYGFSATESGQIELTNISNCSAYNINTHVYYQTVQSAVDDILSSGTVQLKKDVAEDLALSNNAKVILDLNGKTLTETKPLEVKSGSLTVKCTPGKSGATVSDDLSVAYAKSGKIINEFSTRDKQAVAVKVSNGAQLTVTSGTIESKSNYAVCVSGDGSTASVRGGYVLGPEGGVGVFDNASLNVSSKAVIVGNDNAAIAGNGDTSKKTTINISGGTIIGHISSPGYVACGIYQPQGGDLVITGGKIAAENGAGVVVRGGKVSIEGGIIEGAGSITGRVGDSRSTMVPCSAVYVDGAAEYPESPASVAISGGSFKSDSGVDVLGLSNAESAKSSIKVSQGEKTSPMFSSAISSDFCADGFFPAANPDGTYGVTDNVAMIGEMKYTSLKAAFAAASDGCIIKLTSDVVLEKGQAAMLYSGYSSPVTLDLNGHKVAVAEGESGNVPNEGIVVSGNLVIDDSSEAKSGEIVNPNSFGEIASLIGASATIKVKAGKFTSGNNYLFHRYAEATNAKVFIQGGSYSVNPFSSLPELVDQSGEYYAEGPVDGYYTIAAAAVRADAGSYYRSLSEALVQQASDLTLMADLSDDVVVDPWQDVTIDLNGHKLTNVSNHTITNKGKLTIKDSGEAKTGTVDCLTHAKGALVNEGTATLAGGTFERSLEAGTYEPDVNGGNSWYTISNAGVMTIEGGTTVLNVGGFSSNIANADGTKAELTINGGTFTGGVNAVKNGVDTTLTINGGTFANTTQYVVMNWSTAKITGGEFLVGEAASAVLFSSTYADNPKDSLEIAGGTFKAATSDQKMIRNYYDADNTGNVAVSGGAFSGEVPSDCCAKGFAPAKQADGTYGVSKELAAVDFKGGSLRMDYADDYSKTCMRFKYRVTLPEGAELVSWSWDLKYGTIEGKTFKIEGVNKSDDGQGFTSNLVITGIGKNYYSEIDQTKMTVVYKTASGEMVTYMESDWNSRSVKEITDKILAPGSGATADEIAYAKGLQSAMNNEQ